jgi:hypothetical protein
MIEVLVGLLVVAIVFLIAVADGLDDRPIDLRLYPYLHH